MKEKIVQQIEGRNLNILWDHQLIKLTGLDTESSVTVVYQDNPPNTQIPMHVHQNEDELYTVIEGEIEFTVDGKTTLLKGGDIIFLPRNLPHTWKVVGPDNAKVYLNIFPSGLENMFEELNKLPAGPPDFSLVAEICGRYGISFL